MTDIEIIRAADYRRMAWKNGVGSTAEIAAYPEGSSLNDFEWRLSMADVEQSGSFSSFPGVDRTIAVLDGAGIELFVEERQPAALTTQSAPYTFPADIPTHCELVAGPVTDLNVMTRRTSAVHTMRRLSVEQSVSVELTADFTMVFCAEGSAHLSDGPRQVALHRRDTLIMRKSLHKIKCDAQGSAEMIVIEISLLSR